jgi:hypothetical protein
MAFGLYFFASGPSSSSPSQSLTHHARVARQRVAPAAWAGLPEALYLDGCPGLATLYNLEVLEERFDDESQEQL